MFGRKKIFCCNPECDINRGIIKWPEMFYDPHRNEVYHGYMCVNNAANLRGDISYTVRKLSREEALELLAKGKLKQP